MEGYPGAGDHTFSSVVATSRLGVNADPSASRSLQYSNAWCCFVVTRETDVTAVPTGVDTNGGGFR